MNELEKLGWRKRRSLGRIVAAELSAKLFPVTLQWQELRASDLQGRTRAAQSLVSAGADQERALEMAGLTTEK